LPLTNEKFDALLQWLNSNRKLAAHEYETIRKGLIGIYTAQRFPDAEGLADETIDRVADRLPEIGPGYEGKPVHYFRGVARNIIFEQVRRKERATDNLREPATWNHEVTDEYKCLLKCLEFLSSKERDFLLDYHVYDGAEKIANHELMAKELNVSLPNLRVKAHRARISLEKCVLDCVDSLSRK